MSLPSFADLGLAAVVLVLAIVPAVLALLAVLGVLQATHLDTRLAAWLGPRGTRLAGAVTTLALAALFLRLSWDWSAATHLKPLCAALAEPWFSGVPPSGPGPARLEVSRRLVESGYWTTISAERYRALDAVTGELLAEGDELWIDAGPTRYRCGLASGPVPVRGQAGPERAAIQRILARGAAGKP